jgi:hypothetical protein
MLISGAIIGPFFAIAGSLARIIHEKSPTLIHSLL